MKKWETVKKSIGLGMAIKSKLSIIVMIIGIPAALLPVITARYLQNLTDYLQEMIVGDEGKRQQCLILFAGLAVLLFVQLIYQSLNSYVSREDVDLGTKYIRKKLLQFKCEVRYPYIENYDRFQERLDFVSSFAGDYTIKSVTTLTTLISVLITFVSVLWMLWKVNPWVVILILLTSIPATIITYKQQNEDFVRRTVWMEEGSMVIHYYGIIAEEWAQQEMRHYGLYDYLKGRWRELAYDYCQKKQKILHKHVRWNILADFLRSVVYIAVLIIAAYEIFHDRTVGLGVFTLVFSLSKQMQTATAQLFGGVANFFSAIPYMQEFFYLEELEKEHEGDSEDTSTKSGNIKFEHVTFTYPNGQEPVLKDISVTIRNGEKVAIVGDNGSGKSTFITLLCGMFAPDQGEIQMDGLDVQNNKARIRSSISVVFQDFAHYEDTLRHNITVSDPQRICTDEELIELLDNVNARDVLEQQPEGLDTQIGSFSEHGNNLSGGQWQKVAIARAAYRNRERVMILDEPTSALDPLAEAQLYRDFAKLTGDKTTLLISHRLGITSVVDRILVFRNGRIIEDGSHQELMNKNGYYAKMYQAQAQWYL